MRVVTLSIVTPAFNEAGNLDALYESLRSVLERLDVSWEWVIVDDHSRDDTASVVARLSDRGYRGWTIDAGPEAYRRAIDPDIAIDALLQPLDRWRDTAWPHLLWLC